MPRRRMSWVWAVIAAAVVLARPTPATAQLTFNFDFDNGSAFSGSLANPSYYSQDRRDAILRAAAYISSQLDARGTVNANLGTQNNSQIGSSTLAVGGTQFFSNQGFSNGITFNQATTNNSGQSSNISIDFNSDQTNWWTAAGTSSGSGAFDMQSTALHEMTHALGFSSLINTADGSSSIGSNTYSRLDNFLRLGSAANAPRLINTDGTFNSAQVTIADLSGNNIYFRGEYAMAANGGQAVRMAGGGDLSHVSTALTNGVMQQATPDSTDRRAWTAAEQGMLIDLGWNQYVWSGTSGNWADNTSSLSNPRWQNVEGSNTLSPLGTVTTNLVLTFNGSGNFTATNNLTLTGDRFLVNRIILNDSSDTGTIAAGGSNVLRFGTTIGITPLIRQDGAGAFFISHPIELTNAGLQLGGTGTGLVTLAGPISVQSGQTGGLTKLGTSTFALTANNTYNGGTTVSAGVLLVNGQTAGNSGTGTGAVTVNGGTLGGSGRIAGGVTVASGGTIRGGNPTSTTDNTLTLDGGLTTNSGSTVTVRILTLTPVTNSTNPASNSFLNITGGTTSINSGTNFLIDGSNLTFDHSQPSEYRLATGGGSLSAVSITNQSQFSTTNFSNASGFEFAVTGTSGGDLFLTITPVPEPALVLTVAAAGLGIGVLIRRRRGLARPDTADKPAAI